MFWQRRRSELDFADEISSHIQIEADRLRSEGVPEAEARRLAEQRFGNVLRARDRYQQGQRGLWFDLLRDDVRDALRALRKSPGFALAGVLSLALGIGLNTAVFTLLYSVLLRPLPLPEGDRLVSVYHNFDNLNRRVNGNMEMVSFPEFAHERDRTRTLSGLAAYAGMGFTLTGEVPVSGSGLLVSCNYFGVLGVPMSQGRGFVERDCQLDASLVAVLSYGFWQRQFGGSDMVGRTITINHKQVHVVGVAGDRFRGTALQVPDLWVPVTMRAPLSEGGDLLRGNMLGAGMGDAGRARSPFGSLGEPYESWLGLVGRLQRDATIASARAELNGIARQADALYAGRTTKVNVQLLTRGGARAQEYALIGVAVLTLSALVLLIACLNLMGLLLARAPARQTTMRIRVALGASRGRVLATLLTESALLAGLGCAGGVALAWWFPRVVLPLLPVRNLALDITPDLRVFAFALVVSALAVLIFGLAPALEASRVDLASAMRGDSSGGGRARGISRTRQMVVAAQVAGSLLLLVLAGLFVRGLQHARSTDPGFFIKNVYAIRPSLSQQNYTPVRSLAFYRDLQARVNAVPGVAATAIAVRLPLGSRTTTRLSPGAADPPSATQLEQISFARVTGEYFATMGIPIVRGRAITESDTRASEPLPAVISENMAGRLWPNENPLGKQFRAMPRLHVVVGVARDARNLSLEEPDPIFFYTAVNLTETPRGMGPGALIVRVADGSAPGSALLTAARQIDPGVLVTVQSLEDQLSNEFLATRMAALFGGVFGLLAMMLAVIGVYGAIEFAASQRKREIGLRLALGATPRNVVRMVMRDGAGPVVAGLIVGIVLAAGASRLVRSMLYGLNPLDPVAFLGVIALLVLAALSAMYRPARQAAQADPLATLRSD